MKISILKTLTILVLFMGFFAALRTEAQTIVAQTAATLSSAPAKLITGSVVFSSDSLLQGKTNQLQVLPYAGYLATLSFYAVSATGSVRNFSIRSYLSNFLSSDTTYWTLSQTWDTTGIYLNKPINDTINIKISGMPMTYISFLIKGLAGNHKNVIFYYRVALYRADG